MTNKERIDQIIGEIKRSMEQPNWKPQTSEQMRARANRQRDMTTAIKLTGGEVRQEYK